MGETAGNVTALDTFTGYRITDTFQLRIERIYNNPPYATGVIDSVVLHLEKDTLQFLPDTLFADPDGDTLYYSMLAGHPEIISIVYDGG